MSERVNERDVLELERRFWDAMKTKDAERAKEMTDERCIVVGAQGVSSIDPVTMGRMTEEGPWRLEQFEVDEESAQVRMVAPDVAIVAYRVEERVVVDGKTVSMAANDSSVWVRRDDEWRCALHTESVEGDPYGRDRTA